MAVVTVTKLEAQTVLIDDYPVDVTTGETHSFPAEVTAYPVEKGADITDHVRNKPLKITLECIVSDSPIGLVADHKTRKDGSLPSGTMYQRLLSMRDNGETVTISTSLDIFDDMLCSDLSIPRASGEPHQLRFNVSFTQVTFITNNRTTVRVATPGGEGPTKLGERLAGLDTGFFSVFSVKAGDPIYALLRQSPGPLLIDHGFERYRSYFPTTPVPDGYIAVDAKGERTYFPLPGTYNTGSTSWHGPGDENLSKGVFGAHDAGQVNRYEALKSPNPEDLIYK